MFRLILLSVVILQLSTVHVVAGGLIGGVGKIGHVGFGRIGGLKYGGIGGLHKANLFGIPSYHVGGLYGKSLLLAPNPSEAGFQDGDAQVLADPSPMGGQQQQIYADQQPQTFYDPQAPRQWTAPPPPAPLQNVQYAYDDMVTAQDPNMQPMEDEQARHFKGNGYSKGYYKGYYKVKGCGGNYGPSYGGGYGGYGGGYGYSRPHGHGYGGGYGYRSGNGLEDAQLGAPAQGQYGFAPEQQQQQQQQQGYYERANLMGDTQGPPLPQQVFLMPQPQQPQPQLQQQTMRYVDPQMDYQQQQQYQPTATY